MIDIDDLQKSLTQVTLRYLGYRARLENEIVKRLQLEIKKKKYGEAGEKLIPAVISKLKKMDLIDDSQFIKDFTKTQLESKSKGPYFISHRLFQLGADSQLVKSLLPKLITPAQEGEVISRYITRKYPQGIKEYKDKIKLYHQLKSRGFSHQLIREKIDASVSNEIQYP